MDDNHDYRADDESWISSLPVWARVVALVGIPGAIAIFLVWMGATELPRLVRQQESQTVEMQRLHEHLQAQQVEQQVLMRLLQRICVNTAKSDSERERCFDK